MITGARQVGKTTMLKHLFSNQFNYVTLDDFEALDLAKNDPKMFFLNYPTPIIIDEIQLAPMLFREIKRIVDERDIYGQIIITGSQTFHLMQGVTETLAGRIGILQMPGLSLREMNKDNYIYPFVPKDEFVNYKRCTNKCENIWEIIHRGSMPELYKITNLDWHVHYSSYVRTYIERDVRNLINVKDLGDFSKFMISLAARTGQLLNYTSVANDVGLAVNTIKSWVKMLEASGVVTIIQPFYNNALKRVVKTPMLYFNDTGLVCYLLKWNSSETLMNGAMNGQILATFVVSEILKSFQNAGVLNYPIYFYRDRDMKEIDLIIEENGILYPIEIKKTMNPKKAMVKNMSLLEKAQGFIKSKDIILCLIERKLYLKEDIIAYPIVNI